MKTIAEQLNERQVCSGATVESMPLTEILAWSSGESIGHERIKRWIATGDCDISLTLAQVIDFNLFLSSDNLWATHARFKSR